MSAYSDAVLALSPGAYWALDGTTGGTDLSGNSRTATAGGGLSIGAYGSSPVLGESTATDFAGGYLTTTYAPYSSGSTRSVMGWINRDDTGAYHIIFSGSTAAPPDLYLDNGTTTVVFEPVYAGGPTFTSAMPTAAWNFFTYIHDDSGSGSGKLYVNGVDLGTSSASGSHYGTPGNFQIGAGDNTHSSPFNGKMAHMAVVERAVTLAEHRNLYSIGAGPIYRASGTFTAGTSTIAPPMPAGNVADDILILVCESENEAITLSSAQGFAEITAYSPQSAGTAATNPGSRLAVFWKRAVGADTAPTVADSGDHTTGQIHGFKNCILTGDPWDIGAGGNDSAANDTSGSIPGATTTVANTLVLAICSTSFNGTGTANFSNWTNSDLTNLTERADNSNTAGLGGGHGLATGQKLTAGAYGATTVTLANTSYKGCISLALKGPAVAAAVTVPLATSAATSATTLALSATTKVPLATSAASSTTSLSLKAQTQIPLASSAATASTSLSLSAQTTIPLGASAATVSPTLALSAKTLVDLGTSAAVASDSLALTAATKVALGSSAGATTTSLTLTATGIVPLATSVATATTALSLSAKTGVPLGSSAASSSTSLALTAQTVLPLGTSAAVASPSLALSAPTQVPLDAVTAVGSSSLALTAPTVLPFDGAAGTSTTALTLYATTQVPLASSTAQSATSLSLTAPTQVPLDSAAGSSSATLSIVTTPPVPLDTAQAVSSASLAVKVPTQVPLAASHAVSTAALSITSTTKVVLGAAGSTSPTSTRPSWLWRDGCCSEMGRPRPPTRSALGFGTKGGR